MKREAFLWNPLDTDDVLASVSAERDGSLVEFDVMIYLHKSGRIPQARLTFYRDGDLTFTISAGKLI